MANNNYIGVNGLTTQSLQEILDDLTAKFQSIYGVETNIEQNSPDGQWLNILAQEKKDILDLITTIYNNFDVDSVIGLPQQVLYKLNGLTIKAYTYSYVSVNVTVSKSLTLNGLDENIESETGTGFTVSDSAGNNWILTETTDLAPGTHLLNFRAENLGNIQALANTINVMNTIIAGVTSVNNPDNNYVTGDVGETAAEFRLRRNRTMAVASQGFDESIISQLNNITNVTQAKVYDNRTNTTVDTIPPHTVWVIVEGGESDEIGRVIYNNIPPGIPMKGSQEVSIEKSSGEFITVNFDRPNPIQLHVRANIKRLASTILDEDYIKKQLALIDFQIGEAAESANLTAAIKNAVQETGNPYDVEISIDGSNYQTYLKPTGLADYFVISTGNIELTVV